jgi:hypothetical protein
VKRIPTRRSQASVEERLQMKARRARTKSARTKPGNED